MATPEEQMAAYLAGQYASGNAYSTGNGYPSEYAWGGAATGADPAPGYGLPTVQQTMEYYASPPPYTEPYTGQPYVAPAPPPPPPPSATSQSVADWQSNMGSAQSVNNPSLFQRMSDVASGLLRDASDGTFRMFDQASAKITGERPIMLPGGGGGGGARGYVPPQPVSTTWGGMMDSPAIYTGYDSNGYQLPVSPEQTYPKNAPTVNTGGWRLSVPSWDETTPTMPIGNPSGQVGSDWSPIGGAATAIKGNGSGINMPPGVPVPPGGVPIPAAGPSAPAGQYSFPAYNPLPTGPADQYTFPDYNPIQSQEDPNKKSPPGYVPPGGVPPIPIGPPIPPIIPPPFLPVPPGGVPPIPIGPPMPNGNGGPTPPGYTFPDYNPIPPAPGAPAAPPPAAGPGPAAPAPAAPAAAGAPVQETPLITPDGTVYGVLTTNATGQTVVRKVPKNKPNRWNIPQLRNTGIRQGVVGMLQGSNVGPNLPPGITQTVPPGFALPPGFMLPRWAEQNPLPPPFYDTVAKQNEQQMRGREPNRDKLRRR